VLKRPHLEATHDDTHHLTVAMNKRGTSVKVNRVSLMRLMFDHSKLLALHRGEVTGDK
jgi:hypothetical protein